MYVPTITVNTTYSFDRLAVYPQLQKSYGQGVRGIFDPYSAYSFGPKISEWGTYTNQLENRKSQKLMITSNHFSEQGNSRFTYKCFK